MQNVSALFEWAMANIAVGWPPANIAAANMQVPVWIGGDRRLTSLSATLCSPGETMGVSLQGEAIDVNSIVASESLPEACHRDCAPVIELTASLFQDFITPSEATVIAK